MPGVHDAKFVYSINEVCASLIARQSAVQWGFQLGMTLQITLPIVF